MRVLLVEDDPELADVVARGLRRDGFAVDIAEDGRSALQKTEFNRDVGFAAVGLVSTALSFLIYLALRGLSGPIAAVAVALVSTSTVNSWTHPRWSLGRRVTVHARGSGQGSELVALGASWASAGILRFLVLSHWTAPGTTEPRT